MKSKKFKWAAVFLVIGLILVASIYWLYCMETKGKNQKLSASGTLEAEKVDLAFRVTGTVENIFVKDGEKIERGDRVAEIDNELFKKQVDIAEKEVEIYEKQLENKKGTVDEEIARAELEKAKTQKELADINLSYTKLNSPVKGIVSNIYLEEGEIAQAGSPVVSIVNPENIYLNIYLSQQNLQDINVGSRMRVFVDAYPNKVFAGKVVDISDEAEFTPENVQTSEERTKLVFEVKIRVEKEDYQLLPGMTASAEKI